MREPYRTLFGDLADHSIIGPHLQGEVPNFPTLFSDDVFLMLSSGEQIICNVALAIYNGNREATIADLARLDADTAARVLAALSIAIEDRVH
jgi:hypothetical protein